MSFEGFPPEGLKFLRGLAKNNNRAWFQEHRAEYEDYLLEPAKDFVVTLGAKLRRLSKDIHAEPRINGSIFRINRDTRFSKDKRPYKDHLDLWFWQGRSNKESPGYWFRLTPQWLMLGAGMHGFDHELLERYRRAVVDAKRGPALERAAKRVLAAGPYELGGRSYKRVPRGFDPDHPRAGLLLHNALYVGATLPVPPEVRTPAFPDLCLAHYRRLKPLQDWAAELAAG